MVTFTGRQARLDAESARHNELAGIEQRYFKYPLAASAAEDYLLEEAQAGRDCYFGVHLFKEPGSRRAANAVGAMSCLWLDEDGGRVPESGPQPTAIVRSSADRRHLYWKLTRPQSAEWVVGMNRRIAAWAGGDAGKAGLTSVLRVPETYNYKRHPQIDRVTADITGVHAWSPEVMEQAIPPLPELSRKGPREPYDGPSVDIGGYLGEVEIIGKVPDTLGTKFAIVCPWVDEHSGSDRSGTFIGQRSGGGLWFHCHHEHCYGRGWRDFRRWLSRRPRIFTIVRGTTILKVEVNRANG